MRITSAIHRDRALHVEIDGFKLYAFQTKYTILEMGYALFLFDGRVDEEWLRKNGETIPADPLDGRSALESNGCLITSDPILFTLAYEHWWAQNGRALPENVPLPIPLLDEAIEIMRTREILNDFNAKYAGKLPAARAHLLPGRVKPRSKAVRHAP